MSACERPQALALGGAGQDPRTALHAWLHEGPGLLAAVARKLAQGDSRCLVPQLVEMAAAVTALQNRLKGQGDRA